MEWMHLSTRKFRHKKKNMLGRNHTRDYQALLTFTRPWIKQSEKAVDTCDQFVEDDVCITYEQGRKMMARVTKCVKDNKGKPRGI